MEIKLIEAEADGREYPCLVIDRLTGDGKEPTVYFKPAAHISIVLVLGYRGKDSGWRQGHVLDTNDEQTAKDYGIGKGEPIHEDLPLFDGKVILEN